MGVNLPLTSKEVLLNLLRKYSYVFTWTPTDMVGADRRVIEQKLNIKPGAKETKKKMTV